MALGFGELIEGISATIPSLVIAVGEVVTDYTPGEIVAFSIENLGASQKTALTVGIVVLSLAICALLGRVAARGLRRVTIGGFALFGLVGGWAAARNPMSPALASWLVALAAAVLGAATTVFLVSRASAVSLQRAAAADADALEGSDAVDEPRQRVGTRRSFFAYAAGAGVAALSLVGIGRSLRGESAAEVARETYTLPSRTSSASTNESGPADSAVESELTPDRFEPIPEDPASSESGPADSAVESELTPDYFEPIRKILRLLRGRPQRLSKPPRSIQRLRQQPNHPPNNQPPPQPRPPSPNQPPPQPRPPSPNQPPPQPRPPSPNQPPPQPSKPPNNQPPPQPRPPSPNRPQPQPRPPSPNRPPPQPSLPGTCR